MSRSLKEKPDKVKPTTDKWIVSTDKWIVCFERVVRSSEICKVEIEYKKSGRPALWAITDKETFLVKTFSSRKELEEYVDKFFN